MTRLSVLPPRGAVSAVFAVIAFLWFVNLGSHSLWHPDEGRYAEISREMAASGDWVTPRLDDLKYFEKPPFQYWVTAAAYRAFGVHEWTARLWPALAGFLAVVAIGGAGLALGGAALGVFAALALAGTALACGDRADGDARFRPRLLPGARFCRVCDCATARRDARRTARVDVGRRGRRSPAQRCRRDRSGWCSRPARSSAIPRSRAITPSGAGCTSPRASPSISR